MDKRLKEIYDKQIVHNSFLDKRTVEKCMEESYQLGIKDFLGWLSTQDYLSDNIQYIIEEWENQIK